MAVSKSVRRLLHVLDLEEESRRREFESAQAKLAGLNEALAAANQRERHGRLLFANGVQREELCDRCAGQEEVHAGRRTGAFLQQHIQQSMLDVDVLRVAFLKKRVERKQVQTVVIAAEAREALEETRRNQQSLDAWYLMRSTRDRPDQKPQEQGTAAASPDDLT